MAFEDLGIVQKKDGDYIDIVVPDLDQSSFYDFQFAWVYEDKEKGVSEFSDVYVLETIAGAKVCPENINGAFDINGNLKITWEKNDENVKHWIIELTSEDDKRTWLVPRTEATSYAWTLAYVDNVQQFGGNKFRSSFSKSIIRSVYADGYSQECQFVVQAYVDPICVGTALAPVATSTIDGILVSWKDDLSKSVTYRETKVYLSETNNPYDWELVYTGLGPALIKYDTFNTVYIKLNHLSDSDCLSNDSPVIEAKILDLVNFKDYPPDEFTNVTSAWVQNPNTLNDLKITFNLPAANPQKKENIGKKARVYFTVQKDGVDTEEFIDRTFSEPFTHGAQKTITIFADEIRARFLSYNPVFLPVYSNKKGRISSIDQYDNVSPGVPFDIGARVNPLSNHTPTILVTEVANGYSVKNTNTKDEINYYEVYASKDNNTFSKVYSGILPAFILDISYTLTYVKVIGYTLAGDASNESLVSTVTPLSVAEMSLIEFPVGLGTEGSIWSGPLQDSDNDGEPDRDENGNLIPISDGARAFFNRRGFFIYDDEDELTTQIIGDGTLYNNPYAGTGGSSNPNKLTFITKSAQIANWRVSNERIENTLSELAPNTYTGMSGAGNYAFWAGGNVTGNTNGLALFSVTHGGKVVASNIDVLGGKLRVGGDTDELAPFLVTTSGLLTAAGAAINGTINAVSGKMGEVDIGGTMKVLDQDSQSPTFGEYVNKHVDGQLRIKTAENVKIEMGKLSSQATSSDFDLPDNTLSATEAGIQITNAGNKYVQLDSYNGIVAGKGWIGGWEIDKTSLNKANNVGLYAPKNPVNTDIAFWAGGNRSNNPNFNVTYGGKLTANDAIIRGDVKALTGGFGKWETVDGVYTLTKGWTINDGFLESTVKVNNVPKVKLDGNTGTISGANLIGAVLYLNAQGDTSGDYIASTGNFRLAGGDLTYNATTNVFSVKTDLVASNIFLGATNGAANYILGKNGVTGTPSAGKVAGDFSLGNGAITYSGGVFTVDAAAGGQSGTGSGIKLGIVSDSNGTFSDSTVVQNRHGYLTTGRAFHYGGSSLPGTNTARPTGYNSGLPFNAGDIWFSTSE